jgi:hypothetical protein
MVRLLTVWHWRISPIWKSLAGKNPKSSLIYGADITNNVLEFLGMVVTVWLTITKCTELGDKQACILALGNNTSAIGWL